MSNVTLYVPDDVKLCMDAHSEIRWSEVVRQAIISKFNELKKLELLRKYVEREQFSDDELRWMDDNDWHPIDERQMKIEFVKEIEGRSKGIFTKANAVEELFK